MNFIDFFSRDDIFELYELLFPPELFIWPCSILINFLWFSIQFLYLLLFIIAMMRWRLVVFHLIMACFFIFCSGHLYCYSSSFESRKNGRHSPSTMDEMLIICGSESLSISKLISSVFLSVHPSFFSNFDSLKEFPIWTLYVVWVTYRFSDVLFKISSKSKDVFYFPMKKNSLHIPRERYTENNNMNY